MTNYIKFNTNRDECFKISIPENSVLTGYSINSKSICENGLQNENLPYLYTSGATDIGDMAFANTGIERIFISNKITHLGNLVFSGLSLETIIFQSGSNITFSPSTFENISPKQTSNNTNPINIYYNPDDYNEGFINEHLDINILDDLCYNSIYYHTFFVLYPELNNKNAYWIKLDQNTSNTTIEKSDVSMAIQESSKPSIERKDIHEILFSRDIITIGESAFSLFQNLRILDFTGNSALTTIGDMAFNQCPNIQKILFPYTVMSIGERAFYGCSKLKFLYFPIYSSGDMTCGHESFYGVAPILTINYECTGGMTEMNKIRATFNKAVDQTKTTTNFLFAMNVLQPDY